MPAPGDPVALPGRQSRHTLTFELPGIGLALPAGHARHEVLSDAPSSALYVPAEHCSKVMDADAAPTDAQKPPTGHWLHDDAPGLALYVPMPQGSHAADPDDAACAPRAHGKHMTEPLNCGTRAKAMTSASCVARAWAPEGRH